MASDSVQMTAGEAPSRGFGYVNAIASASDSFLGTDCDCAIVHNSIGCQRWFGGIGGVAGAGQGANVKSTVTKGIGSISKCCATNTCSTYPDTTQDIVD